MHIHKKGFAEDMTLLYSCQACNYESKEKTQRTQSLGLGKLSLIFAYYATILVILTWQYFWRWPVLERLCLRRRQ